LHHRPPEEISRSVPAPTTESLAKADQRRLNETLQELAVAKHRVERDAERVKEQTQAELIAKLFPVLDGLDRSMAAGSDSTPLLEGIKLVRTQLEQVLSDYGLERIESVGQPFDPKEHEAVDVVQVEAPREHNTVMVEWEAGYRFCGRVLRAARVRVGKLR